LDGRTVRAARRGGRRDEHVNDTADRTFSSHSWSRIVDSWWRGRLVIPRILASGLPLATAPKAIGKQNGDCSRLLAFCTLSLTSFHFHKGQSGVDVPCLAEKTPNLTTQISFGSPIRIPCANPCTTSLFACHCFIFIFYYWIILFYSVICTRCLLWSGWALLDLHY